MSLRKTKFDLGQRLYRYNDFGLLEIIQIIGIIPVYYRIQHDSGETEYRHQVWIDQEFKLLTDQDKAELL